MIADLTEDERQFVIGQYQIYSRFLDRKTAEIQAAILNGQDVVGILVRETKFVLTSGMTTEQIATALVTSIVCRVLPQEVKLG